MHSAAEADHAWGEPARRPVVVNDSRRHRVGFRIDRSNQPSLGIHPHPETALAPIQNASVTAISQFHRFVEQTARFTAPGIVLAQPPQLLGHS